MRLIVIGPQGSGKGTQSKLLSAKLGIPHISTGDLLRKATGELRNDIDSYIVKGNLYPDEKMLAILKKRFEEKDCERGFILDGFPRNVKQAKMLDRITPIDVAIELTISDEAAIKRLAGRVVCLRCGHGYHVQNMSSKKEGICDLCGGKLAKRDDDTPESIKKRLKIYYEETEPVLFHYEHFTVNGEKSINEVQQEILQNLNK